MCYFDLSNGAAFDDKISEEWLCSVESGCVLLRAAVFC